MRDLLERSEQELIDEETNAREEASNYHELQLHEQEAEEAMTRKERRIKAVTAILDRETLPNDMRKYWSKVLKHLTEQTPWITASDNKTGIPNVTFVLREMLERLEEILVLLEDIRYSLKPKDESI